MNWWLVRALALMAATFFVPLAWAGDASPPSMAKQLGDQLDRRPLIAIGESHRSARFHRFLDSLIRDRDFICRVDDIVVEFGNSALQATADRYVGGGEVSRDEKVRMWRDTGQWLVWDSPVYERFFDTVREINQRRLCPRPVRVLLGDPPIRWEEVRSAADYRAFAERDQAFAGIVEREVLARDRRALLIIGGTHILKGRPREYEGGATVGEILERRHPGLLFAVLPTEDPGVAAVAGLGPRRRLAVVRELPLGAESYARLASARTSMRVTVDGERVWRPANALGWPATAAVVDALLLLDGEDAEVRPDPAIYRDPAYQAELRRRAAILAEVYGMDFLPELEALLAPDGGAASD